MHQSALVLFVIAFVFVFSLPQLLQAQQLRGFDDGLRIGASLNFGNTYFESDYSSANDDWSGAAGYQTHLLYGYSLSSLFAVESGVQVFVNRYRFEDSEMIRTNEMGEEIGVFAVMSMDETVGTTYLGLPVNLIMRPLGNRSFYALLGPEISLKVAHKNGTIVTEVVDETGDFDNLEIPPFTYDPPAQSNSSVLFVNAALGYSFDSHALPLNIELGARQAVTPYISGGDYINRWMRNASFTVSYRL